VIIDQYVKQLKPLFYETPIGAFIDANPFVAIVIPYIPLIFILLILIFIDVLRDVWRMYVGMFLEIMTITLYFLARDALIVFAFINFIVIMILAGDHRFKFLFAGIAWVRTFLMSAIVLLPPVIESMLVFIPIIAIVIFFLCLLE